MTATQSLPFTLFDSNALEMTDRFEAWRESIAPVFDVTPLSDDTGEDFRSVIEAYHLGEIMAGSVWTQPQNFHQARRSARTDHMLVQVHRTGGYRGELGGTETRVREGYVSVIDLAQPLETVGGETDIINILIPRDYLSESLSAPEALHGLVLPPERGTFLGDYLQALLRRLPSLSQAEAPEVARITRDMIAACVRADAEAQERVRPQLAAVARTRVKRYIEANLAAPDLAPEAICAAVGLSRSSLYRLFEGQGGVVRYIQDRRLARIRASLQDPDETRSIGVLAEVYGFRSQAHFSRSFRSLFDISPQDLRQRSRQEPAGPVDGDQGDLKRWIDLLGF